MYASATLTLSSSPSIFHTPPRVSQNVITSSRCFTVGLTSSANLSKSKQVSSVCCWAASRRHVRYDDDDMKDEESNYNYNEEISILEFYTQFAKEEALLVNAVVDDQQLQLLIFKGFSSSLSSGTCFDPTRSILPARAVIQSIDRVKAPFDPSNIDYIQNNLQVEAFKTLVHKIKHLH